ncbi:MAG: SurA N-terminal domain-containing protein [Rickettsiales bacterium]|nr:SurA N-terminal domain-containing protein [Rickettsiales bacterium]
MLEYLRNASEKPLAKVLMFLLIFSFVGWGVADWILGQSASNTTIVNAGGAKIEIAQFEAVRSRAIGELTRAQQKELYADKYAQARLNRQILSELVSRTLLDNRGADLKYTVSNAALAGIIRTNPLFMENGKFSAQKFDYALMQSGMTEAQYSASLRDQAIRALVVSGFVAKMPAAKFTEQSLYNGRNLQKKISYATVKFADFNAANPTDKQLAELHAQNPIRVPESRVVNYVLLEVKMDVPDAYDRGYKTAIAMEDMIVSGESMRAASDKSHAKFVSVKLTAGQPAADAVLAGRDAEIFAMDSGVESEIIETSRGFAIIRVESVAPQHNAELSAVRGDLAKIWKMNEQKKQAYLRANELLNAKKFGTAATVSRAGGAPLEVLNAAFANGAGTQTIVPGASAFFVLNIESEIVPKTDAAKLDALRGEAQKMLNLNLTEDYTAWLNRQYKTKVNQKLYNRIFGE